MECALELSAGFTYVLYTDCGSVKGDTQLTLLAPDGAPVAFNDGFPFCPGDTSASLIEYQMPCGLYGASAKFTLQQARGCAARHLSAHGRALTPRLQDCFEDTACSGAVVVEYSAKEPALDCGRGPFACAKQDAACEALGDLYYATNGAAWTIRDGWDKAAAGLPGIDYCSFYVYGNDTLCTGGAVANLALRGNGLTGTLPSSLGRLSALTNFNLAVNQIGGSVPASLASLTMLTQLWLVSNALSGTIPPELGALTRLETLRFDFNAMSGTLPDSLGLMTRLTWLDVDAGNTFSGTLPASYSALTNLNTLYLDGLRLTGTLPESYSRLTLLEIFELDHNMLSGTVAPSFVSLTRLRDLCVARRGGAREPSPAHSPPAVG